MPFHDLGGLIWVIIILLGVFSSIRRSIRRANPPEGQQATQNAQAAQRMAEDARRTAMAARMQQLAQQQAAARQATAQQQAVQRAVVPPPPVARPQPAQPPPRPPLSEPPPMHVYEESHRRRAGSFASLFEKKGSIIRAIVAAEVLGTPRAFAEQSIWSPRHTEP